MSPCMIEQVTSATTRATQSATVSRMSAMPNTLPSKIPRFEKSSSHSISDDTLTRHLTALWEREDSAVPITSAAPVSRAGNKRKAASVSSYLLASKPDLSSPSTDTGNQLSTSTILSQLLSPGVSTTSPSAGVSVVSSVASDGLQLTLQKNILLLQDRQNVAAAKQSSAVNAGSLPLRRSTTESSSATNNIFRLPTYQQVIGNGTPLASSFIKARTGANDVFLPSAAQAGSSSSVGSTVVTDAVSSATGASSLLLNQPTSDGTSIANHMMLDDNELLRQLEQILSEPGLSLADIDNVFGGCLVVPPSLPQSLSAVDQKAISLIQSQLMSVEAPAAATATSVRNGALSQLLSGRSPLTSDSLLAADKSELRSHGRIPSVDNQPLLSAAAVNSSHAGLG